MPFPQLDIRKINNKQIVNFKMNRLIFLDIAKAVCIVLVVIGHYIPQDSPDWWKEINHIIYSFHMPLFLFASGVAYMLSQKRDYFAFIKKKVKRLMVPYFTVSVLIIGAKLLADNILTVENPKQIDSLLRMFYYPEAGYFLWFIWVLFLSFLIVPFFKSSKSRLALLAVSFVLFLGNLELTEIFCIRQFCQFFIFFILGAVAYDFKDKIKFLLNINALFYILAFAGLYYFCSEAKSVAGRAELFIINIAGIAMVISISRFIEKINLGKGMFITVSSASYIIYLLHTTFEGFAKAVIAKTGLPLESDVIFAIVAIIVIACGVIIPILLYNYIIKRYKATRFLFGLS